MSRGFSNRWKSGRGFFQSLELFAAVLLGAALTAPAADSGALPVRTHTVVVAEAPRDLPLRDLGLREAGLRGAPLFPQADEIRVLAGTNALNASPVARIWINAAQTNAYWFHTGGTGSAEQYVVEKGRTVVTVTRAAKK